jgi:hypothetical protein
MKNIYYIIWSDSIISFKRYHPEKTEWKISVFLLNTWINALNFWVIFIWLKYFNVINIKLLKLDFFPGAMLDKFLAFTIIFALPFGILNYFLIFYKDRYKLIIERYPSPPQKIAFIYSTVIALGAFLTAILYSIIT